jgi:hypothetical protein
MKESERNRVDEMLDLLAEEVAERLGAKFSLYSAGETTVPTDSMTERGSPEAPPAGAAETPPEAPETGSAAAEAGSAGAEADYSSGEESRVPPEEPVEVGTAPGAESEMETGPELEEDSERCSEPGSEPEAASSPPVSSHTARLLGRLALGLLVLLVVINIPFNRHGTTLATAMPDNRALVIRNGLLVKEEDDPEINVYEDGAFRWISSLDAFETRGYTWEDVHVVEDGFLEDYAMGPPIHVLVKCNGSPHIYRVEGEKKRWIVDIEAFEAAGHVWEDVEFVSCAYIRSLPNGETIPPGHGSPPEP